MSESISCPACGGTAMYMGTLGWYKYYRCTDCGYETSKKIIKRKKKSKMQKGGTV